MSNSGEIREKTFKRFDFLLEDTGKYTANLGFGDGHNYVVFSDLHIGDGSRADNFRYNKNNFAEALRYYKNSGANYNVILLGDIEEFHQFRLSKIMFEYDDSIYKILREFYEQGRIYRVVGNHDFEWALEDPITSKSYHKSFEAIKIGKNIMLTHGHQAEEWYAKDPHLVRFGTTFYKYLERIFQFDSKPVFKDGPDFKDRIYSDWAKKNEKILICGHTHCPVFSKRFTDFDWAKNKYEKLKVEYKELKNADDAENLKKIKRWKEYLYRKINYYNRKIEEGFLLPKSPDNRLSKYYFNSGGCLYLDGITNIEIEGIMIRLVYWNNFNDTREVLWEESIGNILT